MTTNETQQTSGPVRTAKSYPHPGFHRMLDFVRGAYYDFAERADTPQTERDVDSAAESTRTLLIETQGDPREAIKLISLYSSRLFSDMVDVGDIARATNNTLETRTQTSKGMADVRKLIALYGRRNYIGMIKTPDVSNSVCDTLRAMAETGADLSEVVYLIKSYDHLEFMNCEGLSNAVCDTLKRRAISEEKINPEQSIEYYI